MRWLLALSLASLVCTSACTRAGSESPEPRGTAKAAKAPSDAAPVAAARIDAVPAPKTFTCASDDDCVVTCLLRESCCPQECHCTNVLHKDEVAYLERTRYDRCKDPCPPPPDCGDIGYVVEARCEAGTCTALRR